MALGRDRGVSKYLVISRFLSRAPAKIHGIQRKKPGIADEITYLLLARVANIFICVKQRPNIHGLAAPNLPVYCPVKRELQRAPVKGAEERRKVRMLMSDSTLRSGKGLTQPG